MESKQEDANGESVRGRITRSNMGLPYTKQLTRSFPANVESML